MGTDNRDSSTQRPPPREPVAALDGALDALQGMLERQRVKNWLKSVYAAFDGLVV